MTEKFVKFIKSLRSLKVLITAITFASIFIILFLNNKYYLPSKLTIVTSAPANTEAKVYWDSGIGFNERETYRFIPFPVVPYKNIEHTVKIERLNDTNKESIGSEVEIESILLNGKEKIDINKFAGNSSYINDNNRLSIKEKGFHIDFIQKFETLEVVFVKHKWAGKVKITIDNESQIFDLYSEHTKFENYSFQGKGYKGTIENSFDLPQIKIKSIRVKFLNPDAKVKAISIKSDNNIINLKSYAKNQEQGIFEYNTLNSGRSKFHILLLLIQLLLALIISWLIYELYTYIQNIKKTKLKDVIKYIFCEDIRYVFWIMFLVSFTAFFLWLLGEWPGIMTVDSFHFTWREIKTFNFQNVTPIVYNLYILLLTQIYDSPVIVSLFQISIVSLLGSSIFYFCYKNGANKILVEICFLLFITSIPVGVYNITMWKDIPFNTIMIFMGFLIFKLYFQKKYQGINKSYKYNRMLILSVLFCLLLTLRHNGLVFIFILPLIMYFLLNKKNFYQFLSSSIIIILLIYQVLIPSLIKTDPKQVNDLFSTIYRIGPLASIYSSKYFYSPNIDKDKKYVNKWQTDEELKNNYTPVIQVVDAAPFLAGWDRLNPNEKEYMNYLYKARSLQNLHIFFADRAAMLLGTMGLSSNVFIYTDELEGVFPPKPDWRPIEAYKYIKAPKVKSLNAIEDFTIRASKSFRGEIPLCFLFFNTFPYFILLIMVLFLYKWFPGSALYSFFFLWNIPFLFIALSTCEWRYLYFLLLSSYFVLPFMSLERNVK